MPQKKKQDIDLMILDIDNTLIDHFNVALETTDWAVKELGKSRGIEPQKILDYIGEHKKEMSPEARFHDISKLIKAVPMLHNPKDEEEAKKFARDDAWIAFEVAKRRRNVAPYPGVMSTLNKASKAGTGIVFYSDSSALEALKKVYRAGFNPDDIAGVYVRKNQDEDALEKSNHGKFGKFLERLGKKLHYNEGWKPSPARIKEITLSFDVRDPKRAVMVGDNINSDGGSAVPVGVNFAWQKQGAVVPERNLEIYDYLNTLPHYKVGIEAHLEKINDQNRPDVVLENGFPDLPKHYHFTKGGSDSERDKHMRHKVFLDNKSKRKMISPKGPKKHILAAHAKYSMLTKKKDR